ncbi:Ras GTPase activating protein ira2, partial [Coemansia erecta]
THTSQSTPLSSAMMEVAVGTSILTKFVRACIAEPTADMSFEIQEAAGAVFMFVSSTNWNVAMQRAKSCLYLVLSRGDDMADLTDIRFLEFATMDITRLAQVIDAFGDVFTRLRPNDQLKLAIVLRRVIWGFITRCGGTFIDMYRNVYRPASNRIEQLAENLRVVIESCGRNMAHPAFYQLKVMLLLICPDSVVHAAEHAIEHGEGRDDGCTSHVRFIARVRQMLASRDVPECALLAAHELQRVASVLTPLPGNNVSRLAELFENDVNAVVLDASNRVSPYREEPIESKILLLSTMTNQFQTNPEKGLQVFLPYISGTKAEAWFQLAFVHAVGASTNQRYYIKGGIKSFPVFNKMISNVFLDLLRRN